MVYADVKWRFFGFLHFWSLINRVAFSFEFVSEEDKSSKFVVTFPKTEVMKSNHRC